MADADTDQRWLYTEAAKTIRWLGSLYKKVFRIAPTSAATAVCLQIVSNVSQIFAFFLPLKVVILVGSEQVPWYVREIFGDLSRDTLVIGLTFGAVGFYLLHLLADHLTGRAVETGSKELIRRSSKMVMFEDQDQLGRSFFKRLISVLAALVFFGLALCVGFWLESISFTTFTTMLVLCWVVTAVACGWRTGRDWITSRYQGYLRSLSGIVFLAFFCTLLVQFLIGSMSNVIFAIVAMLLARQAAQRVLGAMMETIALRRSDRKINALFYFANPFPVTPNVRHQSFRALLDRERRQDWLRQVLKDVTRRPVQHIETFWRQLGITHIAALDVDVRESADSDADEYLVKVYGPGRGITASHEAALLGESWARALPAPDLLGIVPIDDFRALVFAGPRGREPSPKESRAGFANMMALSWSVEPPDVLVDQYRRSKPTLSERLEPAMAADLAIAINSVQEELALREFEARLPEILEKLRALPVFVFNPDLGSNLLVDPQTGACSELHWARWAIEPVGVGWPPSRLDLARIASLLAEAADSRAALRDVQVQDLAVAACAYVLDRDYRRQNYRFCITALPELLRHLDPAVEEPAGSVAQFPGTR